MAPISCCSTRRSAAPRSSDGPHAACSSGARSSSRTATGRPTWRAQCSRSSGAVRLWGFVPDEVLPAVYNAADGFVLASRRYDLLVEGFGISILEASASGLPVIGTRSGGIPEAVREGETGFLVEPDDPAAVAAAAIRLLGDEALRRRIGAAGRAAVETYYNWDRVAADLIRIDREFRKS